LGISVDKLTKVLIVVVVVLVVALGVVGAIFLQGNLSQHNNTTNSTNQANQTNISVNNSSTTNNTSEPDYISASQAIQITKSAAAYYPDNRTRFTAKFVNGDSPYWLVTAWQNDPKSDFYGQSIGGAKINAITGEVISAMG